MEVPTVLMLKTLDCSLTDRGLYHHWVYLPLVRSGSSIELKP
jgi:hypothetical protein